MRRSGLLAMAALGLTTHLSSVHKEGFNPCCWLVVGGALINHGVSAFL